MKRAALTIAAVLAAWTLTAATVRTATETFVTNRIAIALQSATNYTDSTIAFEAGAATNYTAYVAQSATNYTDSATNAIPRITESTEMPGWAANAEHAYTADSADYAESAARAGSADTASFAESTSSADTASYAESADRADYAESADRAGSADSADTSARLHDDSDEEYHDGSHYAPRSLVASAVQAAAQSATNYTDSTASTLRDAIEGKADATNTYTKAEMDAAMNGMQRDIAHYGQLAENAVSSVNGKTGNAVTLDAKDIDILMVRGNTTTNIEYAVNSLDIEMGMTFDAIWRSLSGKQDNLPYPTNAIPYAAISGKPTFATVATSGSYNDLTDKPTIPSPTAPVASATLAWQSNGSAIVVSVGAAGTLSATLTGWIEGQTQTALITIAAGASVSSEVKLVGYGTWPTGGQFLASATRVGNNVYVTPIVLVN